MKAQSGRFGWTWIAIAVATAALAVPTAQARHSPNDAAAPSQSPTAADDRLGPKYVEIGARPAASPPRTIEVVTPSKFRWDDALIGAGATALAIATVGAATLVVTRRRRGSSLPAGLGVQAAPKERLG
jgi:hypothetical protein